MKRKNKKGLEMSNVEFSVEFGDVNGVKLYELPFMHDNEKQKPPRKK